MLKMLKKETVWSQKKVTHIEKERERVGEEELRHTTNLFGGIDHIDYHFESGIFVV
jgi:hypothetical protein